ncbi:uncharacterized protein LOC130901498 [Diorhabda carinulata]|uniref:uncharacterized protein LOC130901498 n=1 Tax=Diorhabda carinulata TaxID=1163345 RepID=UPI0025A2FAF2|nr:uncharacterized protein LOC130901498 [Diorhabda carinulata]
MKKKKQIHSSIEETDMEKKQKLFSAKEFRQLLTTNSLHALQQFLHIIKDFKDHDYILDYLESGGSCLELLHCLEVDSSIPPAIVFEIITLMLLKINIHYPQYQSTAYEACRYILKSYLTVLNKMINLSSTTPERKSCLKLLTAMVAFSPILAKDILIHINFHSANVELLSKNTGEKDSTRDHFIKFLTAYLVDGHYPALSLLLEKKGFFTSIISGLKFDSAETLCLVMSAMKNFILENPLVSKTAKMKTFNTVVVKDIVNLYNWVGPAGFRADKKKNGVVNVNEIEKSKVNECVHDFLLILCTNHKYGVIFKDHLVGLGKKNQNNLMYTVLESLDRPWEHSYASELVTKICGACPDISKMLWSNLKPFLEPRLSPKWITAMKFAVKLIKELQPSCINYCILELSDIQLFQIVQCLIVPLPVLNTILPKNNSYENCSVKQYVLLLLLEMLKSLQQYIIASNNLLVNEKRKKFKFLLSKHLSKHFPSAKSVLENWNILDENSPFSSIQILQIIFDIFNHYKIIAPDLLDNLNNNESELYDLLIRIEKLNETKESIEILQVKIINVFIDVAQSQFTINSKMFQFVVPLLFKIYYNNASKDTLNAINKLFKTTGIFDGCDYEINIWINGILHLKQLDLNLGEILVQILNITHDKLVEFLEELTSVQSNTGRENHYSSILLQTDTQKYIIKHRYLSPMVLGLLSYSSDNETTKSFKCYVNFVLMNLLHLQTQIAPIVTIINKFDILPTSFKNYASSWIDCKEIVELKKLKGRLHIFEEFCNEFLSGNIDDFLTNTNLNVYSDLLTNILDAGIFYITCYVNNNLLTIEKADKFEYFAKYILEKSELKIQIVQRILCHPAFVFNTNFLHIEKQTSQSCTTNMLINLTKFTVQQNCNNDLILNVYREKLLQAIMKILSKHKKYEQLSLDLKSVLQVYGLGYNECLTILVKVSQSYQDYNRHEIIVDILNYSLVTFTNICSANTNLEPLKDETVSGLIAYVVFLAKTKQNIGVLSSALLNYFKTFPHNLNCVNNHLFKMLIELEDLNKDNIKLASFLFEKNPIYIKYIKKNLGFICEKKNLLLPLLTVYSKQDVDTDLIKQIYESVVTSLNKTLQKPQKVGHHFHESYQCLLTLINLAMPIESCKQFFEKLQKFDSTEIFHVHMLKAVSFKVLEDDPTSKHINNIIMTFIHLQIHLFKKSVVTEDDIMKLLATTKVFFDFLKVVKEKLTDKDLKSTSKNETVKLYFKFCLKYGVSRRPILLQALTILLEILSTNLDKEDSKLLLDMLTSHSEFLEIVLGENNQTKTEIMSLYLVLCKTWPEFMERRYVPLLLASYRGLVNKTDRIILLILKMYESRAEQTNFYDFKPFLWGKVAATHYSVRYQIENALWRQPKMSDVLDILQENLVISTITNYPLRQHLRSDENELLKLDDINSYDLLFLLPLFSQLLAPEQQVQTYKFTRSGALSLTVVGLSSDDKEIRQAACHVLARLHYHVDARQTGKDNLLWIRYIEAVCKGTALLPDFKLNNFAAIYLARMALILTQPNHVMYVPLSQHLTAKSSLDFSTVPELYTFLHSSDVNFKEHRNFILELLVDGLRTEKDFTDFMRSMAFKLISELYSSTVSDLDTKLLILDVFKVICDIPLGIKVLCESYSFLVQVFIDINNLLKAHSKDNNNSLLIKKNLEIVNKIIRVKQDRHTYFTVYSMVKNVIFSEFYDVLAVNCELLLFEILIALQSKFNCLLSNEFYNVLLGKVNDPLSNYLDKYGCDYFNFDELDIVDKYYNLRKFVINFKKNNST